MLLRARTLFIIYREFQKVLELGKQKKKTECITTLGLQQIREL